MNERTEQPGETADGNVTELLATVGEAATGDSIGDSNGSDGGRRTGGYDVGRIQGVASRTEGIGIDGEGTARKVLSSSTGPAKSRINFAKRVGSTDGGTEKQTSERVFQQPKTVAFEMPEGKRPVGRPKGSTSSASPSGMNADDFAFLISALFGLYGMSRPIYLQKAWEYSPADCQVVADKLIICIKQLPQRYAETISKFAAPTGLVVALGYLVNNSVQQEKRIHEHFTRMVAEGQATEQQLRNVGYVGTGVKPPQTQNPVSNNGSGAGNSGRKSPIPDTTEFPPEFFAAGPSKDDGREFN